MTSQAQCDAPLAQLPRPHAPRLSQGLTLLLSMACGLAVANVYFVQPLLDAITQDLRISPGLAGTVVTATQAGYAMGLVFIVALGDKVSRKHLMLCQTLLSAAALAVAGCAGQWPVLLSAMILVGMMAVLVQVIVAHVAALASPQQRGQAVGSVTSGVVMGILLARLASGIIADLAGWRTVFFVAAGLMLTLCVVLANAVPATCAPRLDTSYPRLVGSLFKLFVTERTLRVRGLLALLIFAAFSVLWTAMVLPLSAAPLSLSHTQIGLFGLAGVAGALAASKAGRWADRGLSRRTTGIALALLTLSWLPTALVQVSWLALVVGVIILDFAVQAVHVTNQSLIFAARPDAQSRLVGAYMCFYSLGSALGAVAATQVYAQWGWVAVCLLGASISGTALAYWAWTDFIPGRESGSRP